MTINLTTAIDNASLQIGDTLYVASNLSSITGSRWDGNVLVPNPDNTEINQVQKVGIISNFDKDAGQITIDSPLVYNPAVFDGAFLMFAKDRASNESGLVGYYAEVHMKNTSQDKIELFSVGSSAIANSSTASK